MTFSTCCGCFSLQNGSMIIGFLHLIFGSAATIWTCVVISSMSNRLDVSLMIQNIGLLTYFIIQLIITVSFIIGVVKRIPNFVFIFTSLNGANIILTFVSIIIWIVLQAFLGQVITTILIFITGSIIGMSLQIYLWLVIYYFYQELLIDKYRKMFQPNSVNYSHPVAPGMIYSS